MLEIIMQKAIELMPLFVSFGAIATWVFKMKENIRILKITVKDLNERINTIEKRHGRFEDKLEEYMKDTTQRIDNCRESILSSVNNNMHILLKALTKG
jgi:hypothetical protein